MDEGFQGFPPGGPRGESSCVCPPGSGVRIQAGEQASRITNSRFRPAQSTEYKGHKRRNGSACSFKNLIFKPGLLSAYRVGAHDAVDRIAIDSPRAMTLQSPATPEVLEKPGFVSPALDDFDPFAPWAATLDGAVEKHNLFTGEPASWI